MGDLRDDGWWVNNNKENYQRGTGMKYLLGRPGIESSFQRRTSTTDDTKAVLIGAIYIYIYAP
jgi:hypothetical protein